MNLSGRIIPACVVATLLAAAAWAGAGPKATAWPGEEWATATPESVGLDSTRLLGILEDAGRQAWRIDSIQVVRHGKLVLDAYFHPYSAGHPHDQRSVTKSVTSSLLGLSIAQGKWPDVSVTVLSQFPGRSFAAVDAGKRRMTLEDLVDMRSGLAWAEWPYTSDSTAVRMLQSPDWIGFVLDRPMAHPPGSRFDYNAGNMNLLTALIGRAWRQPAREVARDQLFLPVGIRRFVWDAVDPDGNTVGESGLYLIIAGPAQQG